MADPAEDEYGQDTFRISHQQQELPEKGDTGRKEAVGQDKGCLVQETPGPVDLTLKETVEDPVEILVGLAERGEIDPWNINIIEVTDRFLNELERRRQLNLQVSGRTLFLCSYASQNEIRTSFPPVRPGRTWPG